MLVHTPESFSTYTAGETLDPLRVLLRFLEGYWGALLQDLVYTLKSLESLDLISKDGLPVCTHGLESLEKATANGDGRVLLSYTFMPAQKDCDDLWSHV